MQVTISHSTSLLSDISLMVTESTLVRNVSEAVADEWDIENEILEISYAGIVLSEESILLSHGIDSNSHPMASTMTLFSKIWFTTKEKKR